MTLNINLTRRVRRRKLKDGSIVEQTRYVLNWRDPRTGEREQRFFERQRDAQERRSELIAAYDRGVYSSSNRTVTVADAVAAWLETKRGTVRPITFATYAFQSRYVVGPLPTGEARRAIIHSGKGAKPKDRPIELLGREKVQELTTRRIRAWHKLLATRSRSIAPTRRCRSSRPRWRSRPRTMSSVRRPCRPGSSASATKRARPCSRPTRSQSFWRPRAMMSSTASTSRSRSSPGRGRPSSSGCCGTTSTSRRTSSASSASSCATVRCPNSRRPRPACVRIPMSPLLREMLLAWRVRCPRKDGKLERVFPALGVARAWPLPRAGGGGPLIYGNFRKRFWATTLKRLGLPAVTPHSARHSFISTLQAQGVEVGLVAKLAGHKNAVVTL